MWISVARPHILSIVFASTLTYGWIFTGRHELLLPLIAVWDWFIVNFVNKAVDLAEDEANGITGAAEVQKNQRAVELIGFGMIFLGLGAGLWIHEEILPLRIAFTAIGLAYNYRLIPYPRRGEGGVELGRTRLKETYFFKNFGSSMLFTLSVFLYPLFGLGAQDTYPLTALLLAILFFIPLELTYEIIYDLRDVDGDRRVGVPTYPVVHGERRAKQIIYGLLLLSALAPLGGAALGILRLREWVVVAGVVQQLVLMRLLMKGDRLPTARECIAITYLGTAQLLSYNLWIAAGLPLGD